MLKPKFPWLYYSIAWLMLQGCMVHALEESAAPIPTITTEDVIGTPTTIIIHPVEATADIDAPLLVALLLTELGYLSGEPHTVSLSELAEALKTLQTDTGLAETGHLDNATWDLLKAISLSTTARQALDPQTISLVEQLHWSEYILQMLGYADMEAFKQSCGLQEAALSPIEEFAYLSETFKHEGTCKRPATTGRVFYIEVPPSATELGRFRVKYPALEIPPRTEPKAGDSVFAIEDIKCKSDGHQVWLLIYAGVLNAGSEAENAAVTVTDRYAMWFDNRREGVTSTTHLCAPSRRFCYTTINFTDWSGKLTKGDTEPFDRALLTVQAAGILAAATHAIDKQCPLAAR